MCIDKHSRHDGRDAPDNAQQSGQFPQICWEWKIIHQPILNTTQLRSNVMNDMQSKLLKDKNCNILLDPTSKYKSIQVFKYSSIQVQFDTWEKL